MASYRLVRPRLKGARQSQRRRKRALVLDQVLQPWIALYRYVIKAPSTHRTTEVTGLLSLVRGHYEWYNMRWYRHLCCNIRQISRCAGKSYRVVSSAAQLLIADVGALMPSSSIERHGVQGGTDFKHR